MTLEEKVYAKFGSSIPSGGAPSVAPQGTGDMLQDALPSAQQLNDPMRFVRACQRLAERKRATLTAQGGSSTAPTPNAKTGTELTAANNPNRFIEAVKRRIAGRTKAGN
jgi:hypothetical protein